jgi:hypothetical protein
MLPIENFNAPEIQAQPNVETELKLEATETTQSKPEEDRNENIKVETLVEKKDESPITISTEPEKGNNQNNEEEKVEKEGPEIEKKVTDGNRVNKTASKALVKPTAKTTKEEPKAFI